MDEVYARYIGDGRFLFGVPTKDLSRAEYDALPPEMQANIQASGLYEIIVKPQQKKATPQRAEKAEVNKEQE